MNVSRGRALFELVSRVPSYKRLRDNSKWHSMLRSAAWVLLAALGPTPSAAGTVSILGTNALGTTLVKFGGRIVQGDATRLLAATAHFREAIVILESPGGSAAEGLTMAELIRARSFSTAVLSGASCTSMCAIVWLTGSKRLMADGAKIGFHAVFDPKSRNASASGNAIAGAYLNGLGFGVEAILFMTAAPPSAIAWLTKDKAADLKIDLVEPSPALTAVARPAVALPAGGLDLWATAPFVTYACERETTESLIKHWQKGSADLKRFVASNDALLRSTCQNVREKAVVVIREISPALPMACVETAPEKVCRWAPLFRLRADPVRTPWPAAKPLAEKSDAEVCRAALAPSGRGWNVNHWNEVEEADRRGLSLEACTALQAP